MFDTWERLSEWFGPGRAKRRASRRRRKRTSELFPTLRVRALEERRLFHAGALVAPATAGAQTQHLPPPPTTTISLDAARNLVIQDASGTGKNDQLTIRVDAAHQRFVISDPLNLIHTEIERATGNGTHQIYVPLAVIEGDKLIASTGAGNDSLTVDLSGGLAGKSLVYDGGAGEQDALALIGASYQAAGYLIQGDTTQIILQGALDSTAVTLTGVEPITDGLAAEFRKFTIRGDQAWATLSDDDQGSNGQSWLTTSFGGLISFASPSGGLTIDAAVGSTGAVLTVNGIDAEFDGDFTLNASSSGRAILAGQLDLHGSNLVVRGDVIDVTGTVATHHATIDLAAQSTLTVSAGAELTNHSGSVSLDAGANGTLRFFGRVDVSGAGENEHGGTVALLGQQVEVRDSAAIDASGWSGGGTVLVGGDFQGANPAIRRATNTLVSAQAAIRANALTNGDGGTIIVWADEQAIVAGSGNLQARGGAQGGNGGLIETSGKRYLYVDAAPDASAPAGVGGTWLLDPYDLAITSGSVNSIDPVTHDFESDDTHSTVSASSIQNALNAGFNVVISTGAGGTMEDGDLSVDAEIHVTASGGAVSLTLTAHGNIAVNAEIHSDDRPLNLTLSAGDNVTIAAAIDTAGGDFESFGETFNNSAEINAGTGSIRIDHDDNVTIGATITADDALIIADSGFVRGGTAAADIVTASDVAIFANSIGTVANRLVLQPGDGTLQLDTDNGSINAEIITDSTGFFTDQFLSVSNTTFLGSSVNIVVNGGPLTVNDSSAFVSLSDDDLTLRTLGNGNITIAGSVTFNVDSLTLNSGAAIVPLNGSSVLGTDTAGQIVLIASSIGTATSPLLVQPGSTLDISVTGNVYLRRNSGNLSTDDFVNLSSTGSSNTISIGTIAGSVTIEHTDPLLFNSLTNDTLEIVAAGSGSKIVFDSLLPTALTAGKVVLNSADSIGSDPSIGTIDIDTSDDNGSITLIAGGPIGDSGDVLRINAGDGLVTLTTTTDTGDIYLSSIGQLRLGAVTTITDPTDAQLVSIDTTAGNLTLTAPIISDDLYSLDAAADLIFPDLPHATIMADAGITARQFLLLRAAGNITSGLTLSPTPPPPVPPHIDIRQTDAVNLRLEAGSIGSASNPVVVSVDPTSDLDLIANSGDLCVLLFDGDLTADRLLNQNIQVQNAGETILLGTLNGSIHLDNVAFVNAYQDDALQLEAHTRNSAINPGDITLGIGTLIFREVTLIADGQIFRATTGLAIDTSADDGNITLLSGGSIGAAMPLEIEADMGIVSATVTGMGGLVRLTSFGQMRLGLVSAATVVLTSTNGAITSGAAGVNIDTSAATPGSVVLNAQSLGATGEPLVFNLGATATLDLTTTIGDATLAIAGSDFNLEKIVNLSLAGANLDFSVLDGALLVDESLIGFTVSKNLRFSAFGDIEFQGDVIVGSTVELVAGGTIIGGGAPFADVVALVGPLLLTADEGIGTPTTRLSVEVGNTSFVRATTTSDLPDGSIYLVSPGILRLAEVVTEDDTHVVDIMAFGDIVVVESSATDDIWILDSGGSLVFDGMFSINAAQFDGTFAGAVISGTADIDIDTSDADGAILLKAAALGASNNELALKPGVGDLELQTTFGGMWIAIADGDLSTSQIATLQGGVPNTAVTVSLNVRDGSLIVDSVAGLAGIENDLLTLCTSAGGDIRFEQPNTSWLRAAQVNLNSAGSILSDNNHDQVDIDTSQLNGPVVNGNISLVAAGAVGALDDTIVVAAGQGQVSVSAAGGDIYVQSPGSLRVTSAEATSGSREISFETTGASAPLDVTTVSLSDDQWHLIAGGDLALHVTNASGLAFGRIEELAAGPGARNILIEATGGLIDVSEIQADVDTGDDNVVLRASGDIRLGPLTAGNTVILEGANLSLEALAGSIVSRDEDLHLQVNGDGLLQLTALGAVGDATNPLEFEAAFLRTLSLGPQWLSSASATRIISAMSGFSFFPFFLIPTNTITLHSGHFFLDPPPGTLGILATQVDVDSGVLLGGSGSVAVKLVIHSGGTIDMGFADEETGKLQVFGDLTFESGSTLIADLNSPYALPGKDYDQLVVSGQLQLQNGSLKLRGAEDLQVTINQIVLIDVQSSAVLPRGQGFHIDKMTLFEEGPFVRVLIGNFRGKLLFDGGDGNDVVLSELSLAPRIENPAFRLPPLRLPIYSPTERILPPIAPPPPLTPPTVDPIVEVKTEPVALRFVEVRVVIPLDEAGNTREDVVLQLSAEWLERLPMILRRLPDDRYRIYLMLDSGGEERLVIDVLVRAGRPVEPGDLQLETGAETGIAGPGATESLPSDNGGAGNLPAREMPSPAVPGSPPPLLLEPAGTGNGARSSGTQSGGRLFLGASAAVAAVIAGRSQARSRPSVAAAASARHGLAHGRWWRGRLGAELTCHHDSQGGE